MRRFFTPRTAQFAAAFSDVILNEEKDPPKVLLSRRLASVSHSSILRSLSGGCRIGMTHQCRSRSDKLQDGDLRRQFCSD
jgi:hypothetical protein